MPPSPAESAARDVPDKLPLFLKSMLLPTIAAATGSVATARSVNSEWYRNLSKPSFQPPGSAFGPVWTVLYTMMGIADYVVAAEGKGEEAANARRIYKIQLGLNSLWTMLFFGIRMPGLALIEIAGLWVAIVMTISEFWKISRVAALLLVPYLLWTTFASVLTASIWWKNR